MKNKAVRIAAVAMAAAFIAVGSMGATAYADDNEKLFTFKFDGMGGSDWSSGNDKADNTQTAHVTTETGYVTSTAFEHFTLYKKREATDANKLSDSQKITALGVTYDIPYTTYRGKGSTSYIHAVGSYYESNVEGHWIS